MANKSLAVFVHGWGASREDWWGKTPEALRGHREAGNMQLVFYRYASKKNVEPGVWRKATELLGKSEVQESLGELGQSLWATIAQEYEARGCDAIFLFGHSFGGIVIADAIGYAAARAREGSKADKQLLAAIRRIALCASPIGGAGLAATYERATRFFGDNAHVKHLMVDDAKRQRAVAALLAFLKKRGAPPLTLFYAKGDEVVMRPEAFGPFEEKKVRFEAVALEGRHSDCIADVGPAVAGREANFAYVAKWLFAPAEAAAPRPPRPKKPKPAALASPTLFRESFPLLIDALADTMKREPYLSWQALREDSEVSDQYMLRIFLQQLNFVAARINAHSLGSANLWVAHPVGKDLHLRSEEREGFFTTEQLVLNTTARVVIRPNKVYPEPAQLEINSAGARAFLLDQPALVVADASKYPSGNERQTGVTHILGIPLFPRRLFVGLPAASTQGIPVAITADFRYPAEMTAEEAAGLGEAAARLTRIFRDFIERWPAEGLRLSLH